MNLRLTAMTAIALASDRNFHCDSCSSESDRSACLLDCCAVALADDLSFDPYGREAEKLASILRREQSKIDLSVEVEAEQLIPILQRAIITLSHETETARQPLFAMLAVQQRSASAAAVASTAIGALAFAVLDGIRYAFGYGGGRYVGRRFLMGSATGAIRRAAATIENGNKVQRKTAQKESEEK